jgi:hypothetical protein
MVQTRFTCTLTKADEPICLSYAHACPALNGIARANVDWPDSKGLDGNVRLLGWPKNEASSRSAGQDRDQLFAP